MTKSILLLFIILKVFKALLESWLSSRNRRYYLHKDNQKLAKSTLQISDEDFQKILSYTEDKYTYSQYTSWIHLAVLLAFISMGGFAFLEHLALQWTDGETEIYTGLVFWGLLSLVVMLYTLPFELYQIFKIEEKHGFNRQTLKSFASDKVKGLVLSSILGGVFLYGILKTMASGSFWWILAWALTTFFALFVSWLYPSLLAPIFNKFSPLPEGELKEKIYALAERIKFRTSGIFIMDASKRSSHGNAYFTGLFGEKRIVLFDTLMESLSPSEIVAVLAHELGHFKLHHVRVALIRSIAMMGLLFYMLYLCQPLEAFYHAFGFQGPSNYAAILVFSLWYGIVSFIFNPLESWLSQRNEFAADAFAKEHLKDSQELRSALTKLQKRNQSMPLTDPLYSSFYYSHPPLLSRLRALEDKT